MLLSFAAVLSSSNGSVKVARRIERELRAELGPEAFDSLYLLLDAL